MSPLVLVGLPFSGLEQVGVAMHEAGHEVRLAPPIPLARCTDHMSTRALSEVLEAIPVGHKVAVVYRNPWDTVLASLDSGHPRLVADPGVARRAWQSFHRAAIGVAQSRGSDVQFVSADAALSDTADGHGPSHVLCRSDDDPIASLYSLLYPELTDLLAQLDVLAGPFAATRTSPAAGIPVQVRPGGSLPPGTGIQVVIPCRDDGRYLAEAVASVARASCEPVELTIVDDGSQELETVRVMSVLDDCGYQILRTGGVGLSAARNAACAVSRTAVVLPLDSDNMLRPALLAGLSRIITGESDVVYGPVQYFGMQHYVSSPRALTWSSVLPFNEVDPCALIRRELLDAIGGWDPDLTLWEDWDFWMSALARGARFGLLNDITFDYCWRPGSILRTLGHDQASRASAFQAIFSKHWEALSPLIIDGFVGLDERRIKSERALAMSHIESALLRVQRSRAIGLAT